MFHNVQSKVNKKSTDNVESGTFANNTSIVRNAESFRNMECTLWYFTHCGNYNVNFPLHGKNG